MFPQELTEQSAYILLFIDIQLNRQNPVSAPLATLSIYFSSEFLCMYMCLHAMERLFHAQKPFFFKCTSVGLLIFP